MTGRSRDGATALRLLLVVVLVVLGLALAWAVLANRGRSGTWTFRPFDVGWWTASAPGGKDDPVDGVVRTSRELAGKAREAVWGAGGLVERGEAWWRGAAPASGAPAAMAPTTAAPVAGAPVPADERARLEGELAKADSGFRAALDHLARASPAVPGDAAAKRGHAEAARASLREADARLTLALTAYAALPGHDPQRLERGRQLAGWIRQLTDAIGAG